jgi:hypothetical protein
MSTDAILKYDFVLYEKYLSVAPFSICSGGTIPLEE